MHKIYHNSIAAGIKGITGGEFWVTESHFLNDSTEFTIGTDICMEILEKHMRNPRRLLYACRNDTGFIEWRNKYDFSAAPHLERYTARNTRIHAKNALPTIYYDAAKTQCTSGFLQYLIHKKSFPSMKR